MEHRQIIFTNTMQSDNRGSISSTLLESVKARRPEAWRRLVDLYGQVVYRWCRKSGLKAGRRGRRWCKRCLQRLPCTLPIFSGSSLATVSRHGCRPSHAIKSAIFYRRQDTIHKRRRHPAQQLMQEIPSQSRVPLAACQPVQSRKEHGQHSAIGAGGPKNGQVPGEFDLQEAEKSISRRAVELVRAEFEPRTWEAWWKTAVEGRPAADVAAELGMSLAAVYKAKSRVLLRLRQELAGLHG